MSQQSRIRMTAEAKSDLRDIGQFTRGKWGPQQASRYLSMLRQRIEILSQYPGSAPVFTGCPNMRRLVCGSHLVFYRIEGDAVLVVRILSHSMDPSLHFGGNPL